MDRRQFIQNAKQMTLEQKKLSFASEYEDNSTNELAAKSTRACKCISKMQKETTLAIKKHLAGDSDALKKGHFFLG